MVNTGLVNTGLVNTGANRQSARHDGRPTERPSRTPSRGRPAKGKRPPPQRHRRSRKSVRAKRHYAFRSATRTRPSGLVRATAPGAGTRRPAPTSVRFGNVGGYDHTHQARSQAAVTNGSGIAAESYSDNRRNPTYPGGQAEGDEPRVISRRHDKSSGRNLIRPDRAHRGREFRNTF